MEIFRWCIHLNFVPNCPLRLVRFWHASESCCSKGLSAESTRIKFRFSNLHEIRWWWWTSAHKSHTSISHFRERITFEESTNSDSNLTITTRLHRVQSKHKATRTGSGPSHKNIPKHWAGRSVQPRNTVYDWINILLPALRAHVMLTGVTHGSLVTDTSEPDPL